MNVTFMMVKPPSKVRGADEDVRKMLQGLRDQGICIAYEKVETLTRERAADLYAEHEGRDYFDLLLDQATSGPAHFFLLVGKDAAKIVKEFAGPTKPEVARVESPDSIRAQLTPKWESFQLSRDEWRAVDNVVHCPDPKDEGAVLRELKVIFPEIFEKWGAGKQIAGEDYDLLAEVGRDGFEGLLIHVSTGCQRDHIGNGLLCLPDTEQVEYLYEFLEAA